MFPLDSSRILLTGGHGFLGSAIRAELERSGARDITAPRRAELDLTCQEAVAAFFRARKFDLVIHAAADIGGIGYSSTHPGAQFMSNSLMNLFVQHYAWEGGVKKFVGVGSVCEYPAVTPIPFREEMVWAGYPVETNDAYGISKRIMLAHSIAYRRQYGFNAIHLLPINLYGPKDDFSLESSHVIPALIRKCHEAVRTGAGEVNVWGSGSASREFLYVQDAARGIVLAAQRYDDPEPVNLGTGQEVTIAELARQIAAVAGFTGELVFDKSRPAGQSRRMLDVTRARDRFGFVASTPLTDGLHSAYRYFVDNFS